MPKGLSSSSSTNTWLEKPQRVSHEIMFLNLVCSAEGWPPPPPQSMTRSSSLDPVKASAACHSSDALSNLPKSLACWTSGLAGIHTMDFPVVPLSIHLMFSYHFPFPPPAEQEGSSSSADCGVMGGNKPTRHSSSEAVTAALWLKLRSLCLPHLLWMPCRVPRREAANSSPCALSAWMCGKALLSRSPVLDGNQSSEAQN